MVPAWNSTFLHWFFQHLLSTHAGFPGYLTLRGDHFNTSFLYSKVIFSNHKIKQIIMMTTEEMQTVKMYFLLVENSM